MIYFFITCLILAISPMIQGKHYTEYGIALRFDRFGGRLMRVFPHRGWYSHSGGTFPLRFGTQQVNDLVIMPKWKRIPYEKRDYHQLNSE